MSDIADILKPGHLVRFGTFIFLEDQPPKPKWVVVLHCDDTGAVVLPLSSQDKETTDPEEGRLSSHPPKSRNWGGTTTFRVDAGTRLSEHGDPMPKATYGYAMAVQYRTWDELREMQQADRRIADQGMILKDIMYDLAVLAADALPWKISQPYYEFISHEKECLGDALETLRQHILDHGPRVQSGDRQRLRAIGVGDDDIKKLETTGEAVVDGFFSMRQEAYSSTAPRRVDAWLHLKMVDGWVHVASPDGRRTKKLSAAVRQGGALEEIAKNAPRKNHNPYGGLHRGYRR